MVRALILALVLVAAASASEYVTVTLENGGTMLGWLDRGKGCIVLGYFDDHSIVALDKHTIVKAEKADPAKVVMTTAFAADESAFRAKPGQKAPMPTAADIDAWSANLAKGKTDKTDKTDRGKP
jgi:hypothetical protein